MEAGNCDGIRYLCEYRPMNGQYQTDACGRSERVMHVFQLVAVWRSVHGPSFITRFHQLFQWTSTPDAIKRPHDVVLKRIEIEDAPTTPRAASVAVCRIHATPPNHAERKCAENDAK